MVKKKIASKMTYYELLDQDKWWRDAMGEMIKLENMDISHRLNLLALLVRKAPLYAREEASKLRTAIMQCGPDPSDGIAWQMDSFAAEANAAEDDPVDWMFKYPLMVRLSQLIIEDLRRNINSLTVIYDEVADFYPSKSTLIHDGTKYTYTN